MFTKERTFSQLLSIVIVSLGLACGLLAALVWSRGVRIHQAEFDKQAVVTSPGSQLLLRSTAALPDVTAKQIKITPTTPLVATSSGTSVLIRFGDRLQSNTTYKLTISSKQTVVGYSFTTGEAPFYYLAKHSVSSGEIHRKNGGKDSVLFSGRIDDYVAFGDKLAVSVQSYSANKKLLLIDVKSKRRQEVRLPEPGMIEALHAAPNGRSFGFIFTASNVRSPMSKQLMVYDSETGKLRTVNGFGNKPLKVSDWQFAPDSQTVAVQTPDSSVLLLDSTNRQSPMPIGQFAALQGFTNNGSQLIVSDQFQGVVAIDLPSLRQEPLSDSLKTADSLLIQAIPLHQKEGFVTRYSPATGNGSEDVQYSMGKKQQKVLSIDGSENTYVDEVTVSPNDSYAAVTASKNDGADFTKVISLESGGVVDTVPGIKLRW